MCCWEEVYGNEGNLHKPLNLLREFVRRPNLNFRLLGASLAMKHIWKQQRLSVNRFQNSRQFIGNPLKDCLDTSTLFHESISPPRQMNSLSKSSHKVLSIKVDQKIIVWHSPTHSILKARLRWFGFSIFHHICTFVFEIFVFASLDWTEKSFQRSTSRRKCIVRNIFFNAFRKKNCDLLVWICSKMCTGQKFGQKRKKKPKAVRA